MGDDIESPLLQNDKLVSNDAGKKEEEGDDEKKKWTKWDYMHVVISGVLACGGVVTMLGAIIIAPGIPLYVAGGVVALTSPMVVAKEYAIAKGPGIRSAINMIRNDTNILAKENDVLHETVDDLEDEVSEVQAVEENLSAIAKEQGTNVNKLVQLVKENEATIAAMKVNLRRTAIEDVTYIVMSADTDGDMTIDSKELRTLTIRIQTKLEVHGIMLNVDKFEKKVLCSPSISNVLNICKLLLLDDDDGSSQGRNTSGSNLDKEEVMDYTNASFDDDSDSDTEDMFTIEDKFSAGSVDNARRGRSSLSKTRRRSKMKKLSEN